MEYSPMNATAMTNRVMGLSWGSVDFSTLVVKKPAEAK